MGLDINPPVSMTSHRPLAAVTGPFFFFFAAHQPGYDRAQTYGPAVYEVEEMMGGPLRRLIGRSNQSGQRPGLATPRPRPSRRLGESGVTS